MLDQATFLDLLAVCTIGPVIEVDPLDTSTWINSKVEAHALLLRELGARVAAGPRDYGETLNRAPASAGQGYRFPTTATQVATFRTLGRLHGGAGLALWFLSGWPGRPLGQAQAIHHDSLPQVPGDPAAYAAELAAVLAEWPALRAAVVGAIGEPAIGAVVADLEAIMAARSDGDVNYFTLVYDFELTYS